jgi:magnesium-transporting ATPase (P-type)
MVVCICVHRVLEDHEWQLGQRQQRYGTNEMSIPVKSVAALVADEMWHPFYVFQYFSVIIWVAGDQYYIYAVCIFLITWFSIITSAIETHNNKRRLAELAHYTCTVCGSSAEFGIGPNEDLGPFIHACQRRLMCCQHKRMFISIMVVTAIQP